MAQQQNLDDYLQWRLARAKAPSWWDSVDCTEYNGTWARLIWEGFRRLEDEMGSVSGKITIATTGTDERLDFVWKTFALAADGGSHDWLVMPSAQWYQDDNPEGDKQETHAERKILEAMRHQGSMILPPRFRRWMDTLFILVTKSPCHACSDALVDCLGRDVRTHLYGHLVIAFLDYYFGQVSQRMPSPRFWEAVSRNNIELCKVVWEDVTEEQTRRERVESIKQAPRARTRYDYMSDQPVQVTVHNEARNRWEPASTPDRLPIVGTGGLPRDPRFQIIQFRLP